MSYNSETQILQEQSSRESAVMAASPVDVAAQISPHEAPAAHVAKPLSRFDRVVHHVRDITPAAIVNSGSQVSLGMRALADLLSVSSSIRKGSASPNRLIASLITLGSELMGIVFKERSITVEKQQEYREMGTVQYVGTKTLEALNPRDYILETNGLATIINGVFTTRSGIHQSVKTRISWEILQGAITTVAGLFMLYMPNRERAWQISHGIFTLRAPVAGKQAWNAYTTGVPEKNIAKGDWQQGAKWFLNQAANGFAVFFGGVKKLPDGTVVSIGKEGSDELPATMMAKKRAHAGTPVSPQQEIAATQTAPVTQVNAMVYEGQQHSTVTPNTTFVG